MPTKKASPAKKRPASYHHGDLRRALLDHAGRLLDAHGAEQVSLRDLAKHARVSPAAPYRHFPSKDALLSALAEEGFVELESKMLAAAAQNPADARAQLSAVARAYLDLAARRPHFFRMMFNADLGPSQIDQGIFRPCDRVYVALVGAFASGQHAGWLEPTDPNQQAITFWALLHGYAMLLIDHRLDDLHLDSAERRTQLLEALIGGLFSGLERAPLLQKT
jgi:AcrR family transcriptional regulator